MTRVFFVSPGHQDNSEAGRLIMSPDQLRRALVRISHEILEQNEDPVAIVGLHSRGVELARRISDLITSIEGVETDFGTLDPRLYRDDSDSASIKPVVPSEITFPVDDRSVVLVDDVLYTGRTIRAALDAIRDFGRPSSIQLAVLVDRGHRELPIRADYVGKNVPTARGEDVRVMLEEVDGTDGVTLLRQREATAKGGGQR
jgi:pyrimidine operon attenuation protein/uracil phosphoribosyltransferase